MLGKLSWAAIPFDQPIPMAASLLVTIGVLSTFPLAADVLGRRLSAGQ